MKSPSTRPARLFIGALALSTLALSTTSACSSDDPAATGAVSNAADADQAADSDTAVGTAAAGGSASSAAGSASSAAASSADSASSPAVGAEPVTLNVVSLLPGSEKAAFAAFAENVKAFEKLNPSITVNTHEYEWKATTFASELAGGTLPDVFEIPFTDGKTLIENGQLADMDALFRQLPYADDFNPNVLRAGQSADGHAYAIPYQAYGIGLHYNRELFSQAGLDPDDPPTTWDEVRADAKAIADKTDAAGYMQMTQSNTGGWQLAVATYSRGGRMESTDGETTTATVNNDGTKKSLQFLHDLRWTDDSMGSNFLYDWSSINQAFAAGKIGMFTSGNDVFTALVQTNNIDPKTYGLTVIPLEGDDAGVLTGGTMAAVSVKASDAVKAAALKWIDFHYLRKHVDHDAAIVDAKILAAGDQPVGTPSLPIFSQEQYDTSRDWIADYINVPLDQMTGYTDGIFDQPIIAEPAVATQDLYAALDPVVQAVLTDKNADIDQLLNAANAKVQHIIDGAR